MASGKHASDDAFEFNFKPILIIILVIAVIAILGYSIVKFVIPKISELRNKEEETVAEVEEMPFQIDGYKVLGKISIEKIGSEQYILDSTEDDALEEGVGKLYGPNLNDYGNFCIAGHNYEYIFENLSELEKGDEITITDRNSEETIYEIKEISTVEPTDLTCLLSTDELIQITLITCENGGTNRLIVKADKKDENSEIDETQVKETELDNTENVENNTINSITDNTISNNV